MTNEYSKPVPLPWNPALTKPFWEATKRGKLLIPHCKHCGKLFWFPREQCPDCLSTNWEWQKVSGKGRVYSFVVVRRPQYPEFNDMVPYVLAMIQLDEGVRLMSNVVSCPIEEVTMDMPVQVVFEDITPEWTLFKFRPVEV